MAIQAEAWFIHAGAPDDDGPAELVRETVEVSDPGAREVLIAPIYGSFEANMGHAIARRPIDICRVRGCERAIIGNGGVGRIVAVGPRVDELRLGQHVMFVGMVPDRWGYPKQVMGYDADITGILASRIKLSPRDVVPIPDGTAHDLKQWAAFNVRYLTAWENWRVAFGTLRLQLAEHELGRLNVWTWGGGTGLAEAHLATILGHEAVAIASRSDRLELIERLGIKSLDRRLFADLQYDPDRYGSDGAWTEAYVAAEKEFLRLVGELTDGEGVHVFVDLIGTPVFRATVKALGRQGVVTTAGWKAGMTLEYHRAIECIARHQFIHTHFVRRDEAFEAIAFAELHGWLPEVDEDVASFDELPELASRYLAGDYTMYPCFQVNSE